MKIVFMGTPEFARKSLQRLYTSSHEITCIFTQADKPKNRGMKVTYSPVKELALYNGTPVYQPVSLKDENVSNQLKELNPDLVVVVAYGKMLPNEILNIPPKGCINIHGSILPKYRGASPIQHAILNGEKKTGVTSQYISEEMDAGDIISIKETTIGENETSIDLFERLGDLGAELLVETVDSIFRGNAARTPQNHNEATYAPLLKKSMSPIDWTQKTHEIKWKVRAFLPWPTATFELDGITLKVFDVDLTDEITNKNPGTVISTGKSGIEIACTDGTVIIKELQAPGGKRMPAKDYLRGKKK